MCCKNVSFSPYRDITYKATEFVLLMYHSVYGVFSSALKIYFAHRVLYENEYSAQKKKVNSPEDAKYFSPVDGCTFFHYYREKLICNSGAVNFLFLRTVYPRPSQKDKT